MLWLAIFLVCLALGLLLLSNRQRRAAGLPGGRLIYSDTERWRKIEKPLYVPALGLTGKPDYLVEQDGQIIPIEVKAGHPKQVPYDAHIFQLAAYCLLVSHVYGKRPKYGLLHYAKESMVGITYAIEYTEVLETALLETIQQMQSISLRKGVNRSHESTARCTRCGYRNRCDQVLQR